MLDVPSEVVEQETWDAKSPPLSDVAGFVADQGESSRRDGVVLAGCKEHVVTERHRASPEKRRDQP